MVPFPSLFRGWAPAAKKPVRRRAGDCDGGEGGTGPNSPSYAFSSVQGTRPYNEDVACGDLQFSGLEGEGDSAFFGVFDGHGGKRAAQWAKENLGQNLSKNLRRLGGKPVDALTAAFLSTNSSFLQRAMLEDLNDGCTVCVAEQRCLLVRTPLTTQMRPSRRQYAYLVRMNGKQVTTALLIGTDLYVANAGDSRTILCRRAPAGCLPLSEDHKASVASEAARIKARGGKVMTASGSTCARVNGQLATSRGFGDRGMAKYITAEPDVRHHKVDVGDDFMVLATDGLWDVLTNDKASAVVLSCSTASSAAAALTAEAFRLGSLDNITALVVDLRRLHSTANPDNMSAASTPLHSVKSSVTPRYMGGDEHHSAPESEEPSFRFALDEKIEALKRQIDTLEENQQFFEDGEKIRMLRNKLDVLQRRRRRYVLERTCSSGDSADASDGRLNGGERQQQPRRKRG